MRRSVPMKAGLVAAALGLGGLHDARAFEIIALGVGANANSIVRFDSATPATTVGPLAVTGLTGTLVGIDRRPATGELVGLAVNGNTALLYRIDLATGAATSIGSATVNTIAGATSFGMDFNPTVDRIRVVNNLASDGAGGNANNFRLNAADGTLVAVDPDLSFTGLPGGNGNAPEVAIAYSNNLANPGGVTTIFGIVSGGDRLVMNGGAGPGFPTLQNVGLLGVDTSNNAAFDITGPANLAFAILEVGGVSGLYTVDLTTGAATLVGTVGTGTIDFGGMALPILKPSVQFGAASFVADEAAGMVAVTVTCTDCAGSETVDFITSNGTARAGLDYLPLAETLDFAPGETSRTITLFLIDDFTARGERTFTMTLSNPSSPAELGTPATAPVTITDDDSVVGAGSTDVAVPVQLVLVKPGKLLKLAGKGSFPLPDPAAGGSLSLTGVAGSATFDLPASGWKALGTKGFRHTGTACGTVVVKQKVIKAVCKGSTGTLALSEPGPVDAVLTVGSVRYCGRCGGIAAGNAAKVFKRTGCAVPAGCP